MKPIVGLTINKRLLMVCGIIITMTACSHYINTEVNNQENQELIFENLPWMPTADSGMVMMELPKIMKELSPTDISCVKVSQNGYENKASYYSSPGNTFLHTGSPFWYKIISDRIEIFWAIEDNSYENTVTKVIVALKE